MGTSYAGPRGVKWLMNGKILHAAQAEYGGQRFQASRRYAAASQGRSRMFRPLIPVLMNENL
jgi:hypothetical protein